MSGHAADRSSGAASAMLSRETRGWVRHCGHVQDRYHGDLGGAQIRPSMRSMSSPSGSRHSASRARAISSTEMAASNESSVAAAMPRNRSGSSSFEYRESRWFKHARDDDFTTFPANNRG